MVYAVSAAAPPVSDTIATTASRAICLAIPCPTFGAPTETSSRNSPRERGGVEVEGEAAPARARGGDHHERADAEPDRSRVGGAGDAVAGDRPVAENEHRIEADADPDRQEVDQQRSSRVARADEPVPEHVADGRDRVRDRHRSEVDRAQARDLRPGSNSAVNCRPNAFVTSTIASITATPTTGA
jgi:hypothetical protein